jgi:hypothetical protein
MQEQIRAASPNRMQILWLIKTTGWENHMTALIMNLSEGGNQWRERKEWQL